MKIRTAALPMIVVILAFFGIQVLLGDAARGLALVANQAFAKPWMFVTHMFLHSGFAHLLFNLYALFIFGPLLEQKVGAKRWLTIYFVAGIIAALVHVFIYPESVAVGASAAIMGIIGALIILWPDLRLLLFFIIPTPLWIAGIIFAALDIFGIFYQQGVANLAHLVGLGIGLLFGLYFKKKRKKYRKVFTGKSHLSEEDIGQYLKSGRL